MKDSLPSIDIKSAEVRLIDAFNVELMKFIKSVEPAKSIEEVEDILHKIVGVRISAKRAIDTVRSLKEVN